MDLENIIVCGRNNNKYIFQYKEANAKTDGDVLMIIKVSVV